VLRFLPDQFGRLGIVLGVLLWGMMPLSVQAEQWITASRLKSELEAPLNAIIQHHCQTQAERCTQRLGVNVPDVRKFRALNLVTDEPVSFSVSPLKDTSVFKHGYGSIQVVVQGQVSQQNNSFTVPILLQQEVLVWELEDNVVYGMPLMGKVKARPHWVGLRDLAFVLKADTPLGLEASSRCALKKGAYLKTHQVSMPPLVKSQQMVKMIVETNAGTRPIRLVIEGKALQNGKVGDVIKVKQTGFQQKIYQGNVLEDGRVFVKL
jgi:flagella basal body P-ring formation protein FlgA